MAKVEAKTKPTALSVEDFLAKQDPERLQDCEQISQMMQEITGEKPKMWGPSIVGFGSYHYKYASGHEGDMCITGFSPRKANLTLYLIAGFDQYQDLLEKLGKFKTSVSCLYIKKLADVDQKVLKELITRSVNDVKRTNSGRA
jgi:hypothetical protein